MSTAPLDIRITVHGAEVKRALKGIQDTATKTERNIQKEISKTDEHRDRSHQRAKRHAEDMTQVVSRESHRQAREIETNIETGYKRGFQRAKAFFRANGGLIAAGLAVGAAAAARSAERAGRRITGIERPQDLYQRAGSLDLQLTQIANSALLNDKQFEDFQKLVHNQIQSSGLAPEAVVGGLGRLIASEGPGALQGIGPRLDFATKVTESIGGDFGDMLLATTNLKNQFELKGKDLDKGLGDMLSAVTNGKIEVADFTSTMPRIMSSYTTSLGKGEAAFKDFAAGAEAIAETIVDPQRTAFAYNSLLTEFQDPKRRSAVERKLLHGRKLEDVGIHGLSYALNQSREGMSKRQFSAMVSRLFPNMRAAAAAQALAQPVALERFSTIKGQDPLAVSAQIQHFAERTAARPKALSERISNQNVTAVIQQLPEVSAMARYIIKNRDRFTTDVLGLKNAEIAGVGYDTAKAMVATGIVVRMAGMGGGEAIKKMIGLGAESAATAGGQITATTTSGILGGLKGLGLTFATNNMPMQIPVGMTPEGKVIYQNTGSTSSIDRWLSDKIYGITDDIQKSAGSLRVAADAMASATRLYSSEGPSE